MTQYKILLKTAYMYGLAIVQYMLFIATFSYLHKSIAKVTRDVMLLILISVSHNEILNGKTSNMHHSI